MGIGYPLKFASVRIMKRCQKLNLITNSYSMISLDKPKTIAFFYLGLFVAFIIGAIIFITYWQNEYAKYPIVTKETKVFKKVKRVRREHGTLLIDFSDETKYSIHFARNYLYIPYGIFKFVNSGDSIIKYANSDSLIVKRNSKEYQFVLGLELNKHLDM